MRQNRPELDAEPPWFAAGTRHGPGRCRHRALQGTDRLIIRLRRSKTDQEGAGRIVGIPYGSNPATCPGRASRSWLEVSGITRISLPPGGPPWSRRHNATGRSGCSSCARAPSRAGRTRPRQGGRSFAARRFSDLGCRGRGPGTRNRRADRHRGTAMLRRYIREGSLFRENAASAVGLSGVAGRSHARHCAISSKQRGCRRLRVTFPSKVKGKHPVPSRLCPTTWLWCRCVEACPKTGEIHALSPYARRALDRQKTREQSGDARCAKDRETEDGQRDGR